VALEVVAGDQILFEFELVAKFVRADDRVDANRGCVAVVRGPLVYALESVDLPVSWDLDDVYVSTESAPTTDGMNVTIEVHRMGRAAQESVLNVQEPTGFVGTATVSLVPYYDWAERGASTMRIWIPEAQVARSES
jgi:DUF1680 family protein